MTESLDTTQELSLEKIISGAIQIPGVKVNRQAFLAEIFSKENVDLVELLDKGPIEAGISRETLASLSDRLIIRRTSSSSLLSFAAGIPGGLAMATTIPADILQFFGMSFRLAQELSYLYGAPDLWEGGKTNNERVNGQLILYAGVMFGVTGASAGVRVLTAQIAKTTLKRLPQKALTKTLWYPLVKEIGKQIGVKVTKTTVAQGFSKVIPVVGGVISGGLTFASMLPMARRLQKTLDEACFDYTEDSFNTDIIDIETIDINTTEEIDNTEPKLSNKASKITNKLSNNIKHIGSGVSKLISEKKHAHNNSTDDAFASLEKLAQLKDSGILSQEEFESKKAELLNRI